MKIYYEVLPLTLGRIMHRLNKHIKQYAPDWAVFVDNMDDAEFQILDVVGSGSLENLKKDRHAIFQHCYITTENNTPEFWLPIFEKSVLTVSYMDLPSLVKSDKFPFLRNPMGADISVFRTTGEAKDLSVMTTGYIDNTESISEIADAVNRLNGTLIHVGGKMNLRCNSIQKEGISDDEMVSFYNRSYYVSGLRKQEGFEVPIVEGLLCGTRGICYNKDHYRYWYGDLVEYIEEDGFTEMSLYSPKVSLQLSRIFDTPYRYITQEEINIVKEKFSWETVATNFWKELERKIQ
jgi:glycosyltransferase involved in cell wall biosynthesis